MGIPKMFRFLTDRYPLIMQRLDEDHVFDHFYLDMNGIIHQCTHPNDDEIAIEDIELMFSRIFNYTDRLFRIVAPTTLMFLAVDGVAPRAKMNQQRSRRFRSAKEAERAMSEAIARGDQIPKGNPFDSNCITPGTQFMSDLSKRFQQWIHDKMSNDPAYQKGCSIVFSGSEVPGEGEHKIMDFIRKWKTSKQYDPTVWHCMYGLDADLMMLGLVAHTPHFTLIREKMKFNRQRRKVPKMTGTDSDADEFELLEIAKLREMLFLEFQRNDSTQLFERPSQRRGRRPQSNFEKKAMMATTFPNQGKHSNQIPFKVDARRIVDDFVFMCMLVGNDFIPNIAHLDIGEGAINIMFRIYRHMLPSWRGYLTQGHKLHPDRLEAFLQRIAQSEPEYFQHRSFTDNVDAYKTPAYRRQYYNLKFNFDVESEDGERQLQRLRRIYMEGLHWVLQYYHNGVSSWNWFYPDFYAILASDMVGLRQIRVLFQKGQPFKPLTQLMAVLPPESAQLLPVPMRKLMVDPSSPVSDFYPLDFEMDMNGKRNDWEAVIIVPFIEEKRLLNEVNAIDPNELTPDEHERNKNRSENWFKASDYPRSDVEIIPVRPSKYFVPYSARSRSPSGSPTRSPIRRGTPRSDYQRTRPSSMTGGNSHNRQTMRGRRNAQNQSFTRRSSRDGNGTGNRNDPVKRVLDETSRGPGFMGGNNSSHPRNTRNANNNTPEVDGGTN